MARKKSSTPDVDTDSEVDPYAEIDKHYKAQTGERAHEIQLARRVFQSGCFALDVGVGARYHLDPKTGLPGFVERSLVEVGGPNRSLKTALWEHMGVNIQNDDERNVIVVFAPEEELIDRLIPLGFDKKRLKILGHHENDVEEQFRMAENCLEAIKQYSKLPTTKLCVIDSIAAMCLGKEIFDDKGEEQPLDKAQIALRARLLNRFLSDFSVMNHSSILFMTNQIRDYIPTNKFAPPMQDRMRIKSPGGNGLHHHCHIRIDAITKKDPDAKEHDLFQKKVGDVLEAHFRIFKNKNQYRDDLPVTSIFDLDTLQFRNSVTVLQWGEWLGEISRSGPAYYNIADRRIQGKENALNYLESNPEVMDMIQRKIIERRQEIIIGKVNPSDALD